MWNRLIVLRTARKGALGPLILLSGCSGAVGAFPATDTTPKEVGISSALEDGSTADRTVEAMGSGGEGESSPDASLLPLKDGAVFVDAAPAIPSACAGYVVCDDFESTAVGAHPSPALWPSTAPANCSTGVGTIAIDDSQAHGGKHSVKVTGGPAYCDHVFFVNTSAFASIGPELYARFYVRFGGASDSVAPNAFANGHATLISMTDSHDNGLHLRFGGWNQVLSWNRESDMATLPTDIATGTTEAQSSSVAAVTGQWDCIELHVDEMNGTIDTWFDGNEVPGLAETGLPDAAATAQWQNRPWKPALTDFELGWESYNGESATLWFDDVIIDSHRIGCGNADAGD